MLYGGEYGEDLKDVAEINKLTEDEVIKIHSGTDYLIYMLGFLPGFAYLGGLDDKSKLRGCKIRGLRFMQVLSE